MQWPAGERPERAGRPAGPDGGLTYPDLRRAILLTLGLLALWHLAALVTTVLLLFVLVFVLAAATNPIVIRLEQMGVRRKYGALALGAVLLAALALLLWRMAPPLIEETSRLIASVGESEWHLLRGYEGFRARHPDLAAHLPAARELSSQVAPRLIPTLGLVGQYTFRSLMGVLSGVVLIVLLIYTLVDPVTLLAGVLESVPIGERPRVERVLRRILEQLQHWALGSLALGAMVGTLCALGLWGIGRLAGHPFPYLLLFAMIAGVGELIPVVGPILSAVPPLVVALGIDPVLGAWVALLFFAVQQFENQVIVPLVMGASLDLHPVAVMFAVLVMGSLFGLVGAVLALPLCAIFRICWEEFYLMPAGSDRAGSYAVARRLVGEKGSGGLAGAESEAGAVDGPLSEAESA